MELAQCVPAEKNVERNIQTMQINKYNHHLLVSGRYPAQSGGQIQS